MKQVIELPGLASTAETDIGASHRLLQKTDEFLDGLVSDEYNFQRESLYSLEIPPQLIAGSLLVAGLAGFIVTHLAKSSAPSQRNLEIWLSIFVASVLILILTGASLIRRKYPKVDNFPIEQELFNVYQHEVASFREQAVEHEVVDTMILTKLRSVKISLIKDQTTLCRKENRYRHNVQIVMTMAILTALLTGVIVAFWVAVFTS